MIQNSISFGYQGVKRYNGDSLTVLIMTTIDIANDIPANIDTLERLVAWSVMALRRVNPTLKILETSTIDPERAAQVVLIQAEDDKIRLVCRASIEIDENYADNNTVKLWMHAKEISNTALPEAFTQD